MEKIKVIDENHIIVDGVRYEAFEHFGCESCELHDKDTNKCSIPVDEPIFGCGADIRTDNRYVNWRKEACND